MLKPSEVYPKTKIAEIDGILQGLAAQKALEEKYLASIQRGDSLFAEKAYDGARTAFLDGQKLKPAESYPKERIAEISKILEAIALQDKLEDQYQKAIVSADQLFTAKSYAQAKTGYSNASALKPMESYPKERMTEIDRLLADLAAKKALDEKYQTMLANADKLLAAKLYDQARAEYVNAGLLRPEEEYPKTKTGEIDQILSELAALKSLEEKYTAAVATADQLLLDKNYQQARTSYLEATVLKPAEKHPSEKISLIDSILTSISKQKALNEEYSKALANADQLFASGSWAQARLEFLHASGLKPDEQYPRNKIVETDKALAELDRQKAIDDQYNAALSNADKSFEEKKYEQAKTAYAEAGLIKPAEQYPKTKIAEITTIFQELARKKSLDDNYNETLLRADQFFNSQNYDQAKPEYSNALKIKPGEAYPLSKIVEIDGLLAEIKARDDDYKATLDRADQWFAQKKYDDARTGYQNALGIKPEATYPKEKLAAITKALEELLGKQQLYNNFIADGDHSLSIKDYFKAKDNFQQAQLLFPEESYPKERLNLITARMDSLYRANKSFYDKSVAEGDKFFNLFEFDKAVDAFTQASTFLPMEKYPREMISKITRTIAENAIADVLNSPVTITAGEEKQFSFTPVNIASRKNNFIYLKLKNLSDKPFNILMRYGKDKQPNGGVVIRNLSTDAKVNERLVSVRDQDLWYRADNNWISLYPQGGDIEVSFIQVSRAK